MKNKKKLKGMSLIEIIIAVAVLAVMSMILLGVGVSIDSTSKATNKLKRKVNIESPYAANHITTYTGEDGTSTETLTSSDVQFVVKVTKSGSYLDADSNIVTYSNPSVTLDGKKYTTKDILPDSVGMSKANENLDLKFVEFPAPAST